MLMVSILTAWCTMEPLMKEPPVVSSLTALFWGGLLSGVCCTLHHHITWVNIYMDLHEPNSQLLLKTMSVKSISLY